MTHTMAESLVELAIAMWFVTEDDYFDEFSFELPLDVRHFDETLANFMER